MKMGKKINEEKKNNIILGVGVFAIAILIVTGIFIIPYMLTDIKNNDKPTEEVEKKFVDEYPEVGKDNVFVVKSAKEVIKVLEHGTGVVYLGFPECPWCQEYVLYLNEVAKDEGLDKIYYFNILNDRKDNTKDYQKIVSLISEHLQYDDEGNKRVYVPAVIAVDEGKIVGFDDETAWDTKGFEKPEDYWTDEEVDDLKDKLEDMIEKITPKTCTDCNK